MTEALEAARKRLSDLIALYDLRGAANGWDYFSAGVDVTPEGVVAHYIASDGIDCETPRFTFVDFAHLDIWFAEQERRVSGEPKTAHAGSDNGT